MLPNIVIINECIAQKIINKKGNLHRTFPTHVSHKMFSPIYHLNGLSFKLFWIGANETYWIGFMLLNKWSKKDVIISQNMFTRTKIPCCIESISNSMSLAANGALHSLRKRSKNKMLRRRNAYIWRLIFYDTKQDRCHNWRWLQIFEEEHRFSGHIFSLLSWI